MLQNQIKKTLSVVALRPYLVNYSTILAAYCTECLYAEDNNAERGDTCHVLCIERKLSESDKNRISITESATNYVV